MADRVARTQEEIEENYKEQLHLLNKNSEAFDNGDEIQGKQIANNLRQLLKDRGSSKSLIGLMGIKDTTFFHDTRAPWTTNMFNEYLGNVFLCLSPTRNYFRPFRNNHSFHAREVLFNEWWNSTVFIDWERNRYTRADILLSLTETDGGTHTDPTIPAGLANLKRNNVLNSTFTNEKNEEIPHIKNCHLALIRQMAHEILITLYPSYNVAINLEKGEAVFPNVNIITGGHRKPDGTKYKPNDKCGCNMHGLKYKNCCGESPKLERNPDNPKEVIYRGVIRK